MLVPGRLSVEMAKKMPMTFVMTAEFDFKIRDAVHVARTFEKAGRLAGWCCTPGGTHGWSFDMGSEEAKEYHMEWKRAIEAYTEP